MQPKRLKTETKWTVLVSPATITKYYDLFDLSPWVLLLLSLIKYFFNAKRIHIHKLKEILFLPVVRKCYKLDIVSEAEKQNK